MLKKILLWLAIPLMAFGQFGRSGSGNGVTTLVDTTGNPIPGRIYYVTADSTYYTWGSNGFWKALSPADSTDVYRLISGEIRLVNVADTTGNPSPGYFYFNEADSFYYVWKTGNYWGLMEGDTSCWVVNAWDEIADIPANIDTNSTDDMLAAAFADSFAVHTPDSTALDDSLRAAWEASIAAIDSMRLHKLWLADTLNSSAWNKFGRGTVAPYYAYIDTSGKIGLGRNPAALLDLHTFGLNSYPFLYMMTDKALADGVDTTVVKIGSNGKTFIGPLMAAADTTHYLNVKGGIKADSIRATNAYLTNVQASQVLKLGATASHITADTISTNTYTLPPANGDANQLLKTDGAGGTSWASTEAVYSITIDSTSISTTRNIPFFYVSQAVTIDTVIVTGVTTAAAGTFSVVPQIAHDDTMKSAVAALVMNSPSAATSKTVGDRYTSFTDATLSPKEHVWVKFTTVTTAPRAITVTIVGRK